MFRGAEHKQIEHCVLTGRRGQRIGIRSPYRTASTAAMGRSLAECCASLGLHARSEHAKLYSHNFYAKHFLSNTRRFLFSVPLFLSLIRLTYFNIEPVIEKKKSIFSFDSNADKFTQNKSVKPLYMMNITCM